MGTYGEERPRGGPRERGRAVRAAAAIDRLRRLGVELNPLPGGRLHYCYPHPGPMPSEAAPLLAELREHKPEALAVLEAERETSPEESSDCQRRFGAEHARLFPFLGRQVRHRSGDWGGRLVQVLGRRATVHVGGESTVRIVDPRELLPPSDTA
jgi:hypothetical protein